MGTIPKGVLENQIRPLGEHFGAHFSSSFMNCLFLLLTQNNVTMSPPAFHPCACPLGLMDYLK